MAAPCRHALPIVSFFLLGAACNSGGGASPDAAPDARVCVPGCAVGEMCNAAGACVACDSGPPPMLFPPVAGADPADDYVDATTGRRVVRLSRVENGGSIFYFHQNPFNCRGDKMLFANAHGTIGRALYAVDLETYAIERLTSEAVTTAFELVGRKRNELYYLESSGTLRATRLDTRVTRSVAQVPTSSAGISINADESLLLLIHQDGLADFKRQYPEPLMGIPRWLWEYQAAHRRSSVLTVNVDTGEVAKVHEEDNWLDHPQFSPTDPSLLLFSYQGPHWVRERLWLLDLDGPTTPRALRSFTIEEEIMTHELWSPDGTAVFYDHHFWDPNSPSTSPYSFARTDVATGTHVDIPIREEHWGLHYNISPDGSMLASDGRQEEMKILLYRRSGDGATAEVEPLADIRGNDYSTFEPNVHFTPDGRWVVFVSNHRGGSYQIYAVSVERP